MGVRFMTTICLVGALAGSLLIATGYNNPFIVILTVVAWIFVVIGATMKP